MSGVAGSGRGENTAAAERQARILQSLIGKKVETVSVDEKGIIRITAAGFGGRITVKIGEPRDV